MYFQVSLVKAIFRDKEQYKAAKSVELIRKKGLYASKPSNYRKINNPGATRASVAQIGKFSGFVKFQNSVV